MQNDDGTIIYQVNAIKTAIVHPKRIVLALSHAYRANCHIYQYGGWMAVTHTGTMDDL